MQSILRIYVQDVRVSCMQISETALMQTQVLWKPCGTPRGILQSTLPRKVSRAIRTGTVPQTNTGDQVE